MGSALHARPPRHLDLSQRAALVHSRSLLLQPRWNMASWPRLLLPTPLSSHQFLPSLGGSSKAPSSWRRAPGVTCALQVRGPGQHSVPHREAAPEGHTGPSAMQRCWVWVALLTDSALGLHLGPCRASPIISLLRPLLVTFCLVSQVDTWGNGLPRALGGGHLWGRRRKQGRVYTNPPRSPPTCPGAHSGNAGWRRGCSRKGELCEGASLRGGWPGVAAAARPCREGRTVQLRAHLPVTGTLRARGLFRSDSSSRAAVRRLQ